MGKELCLVCTASGISFLREFLFVFSVLAICVFYCRPNLNCISMGN